ncbi:Cytochrome P450 82A3 like [Actinidia chinensis var. chinensis]|uniref:Cytochrome P450 82A3 like n=1 Tax=Actinidia chinensis var. chinensis TaxID=1590841 RepID=A0A2R6RMX8_ACTCC|nr:Cytochrome P450 82A3 like [Actinidia chinensis var. chinensis]
METFLLPQVNISIGLFTLSLVLYYLSKSITSKYKSPKNRPPPQAGGAWPIIGHLHQLGGSQLPHMTLASMADKHGPIFSIRLGMKRAVVVSNSEIAKECFTTHDIAISSRPKFAAAQHLGYNYAMVGFSPYGAYWRELRKIISVEFLATRRLEMLKHVRVSETETSVKELYKLWREKKDRSGHVLVEMKQWFADLTLNVVVRMVAGKRFFGAGGGGGDEEEGRRCQKAFREFFYFLGLFLVSDTVPFLRWLDLGGREKAMKETGKEMDAIVSGWLEEHRRERATGVAKADEDFMDVMYTTLEGADLGRYDVDTINKATCLGLISGGADTTTVMLTWALSLIMNNRHVLKKAQEELDFHVGKERQVDESDIPKLAYLQAIVKETLRLYPAGPLSGVREFTEDCTVHGYYIAKGTRLMVNLWKIQRDPTIWADPSEFRPERFLTTHKDFDVKGRHFGLIPFGAGRRLCPGIVFGVQMLHLVLARLLHGFGLSTPGTGPVDMTESAGLTNIKATPLEVLIAPRLASNLYE